MKSLKRHDGELYIDNRCGGGPVPEFGNIREMRAPTLSCWHCGGVVLMNPLRTRPREYCRLCDAYICDGCARVAAQSSYIHRSFAQLSEMVTSGRYTITGGSTCDPVLVPTGVCKDG